ncbi:MAG: hypothetical protein LJE95_13900 [Acidobacteria bacterium]|nr:hypothetical protein [Acidobacteriota bacterium]
MKLVDLVPDAARAQPRAPLSVSYRALTAHVPVAADRIIGETLRSAHVEGHPEMPGIWALRMAYSTSVYGLIHREVEDSVKLSLAVSTAAATLDLRCLPQQLHNAHAAGFAGVLALSAAAGFAGGWSHGAPAAISVIVAGVLLVTVSREMALQALERRLRRLAENLGTALWPSSPAQLLPPPKRLV